MDKVIVCFVNVIELDIENGLLICINNMYKFDSLCIMYCYSGYSMLFVIIFIIC